MKVLISTGGSGGHIFPALKTGLELKRRGHEVVFAGALSMCVDKVRQEGFEAHVINAGGLTDRSPAGLFRFCAVMTGALGQAFALVGRIRPDKVIGFGGYGSFPVLMAACLKGYPAMLHEQNVAVGKANRILGKFVRKVAVSFQETSTAFGSKAVWTGCPCHNRPSSKSKDNILDDLGLTKGAKIIVLLGGSQGSQFLNQTFYDAVKPLLKKGVVEAVHVTGKAESGHYQQRYSSEDLPVAARDFISPIEDVYTVADVIISRAGAATVSELGCWAIQSVLVPYPYAHGHQVYNARVLERAGSAKLIEQRDLSVEVLRATMEGLIEKAQDKQEIARKNGALFVSDAAARLADAVEVL